MEHPFGILSLLPPVVAIVLAILTRRVVLSMLCGIIAGVLVTSGFHQHPSAVTLLQSLRDTWEVHLWPTLTDAERLRVFSFTLLMGALIGIITRSGGMQGLVTIVSKLASNRRRGQLTTWLLGLVIFFDDYANSILLGTTLRPIMDKLKVSREKLAYIVDSTAAPVAGLAIVSTWVAVEISYVRSGLLNANPDIEQGAFALFIETIPYRFYVWIALLTVPLVAILGRDMGPMLRAELRARSGDEIDSRHPATSHLSDSVQESGWYNAVLPIALNLIVTLFFLYLSGREQIEGPATLNQILEKANSSLSLQYGAAAGLVLAWIMIRWQGRMSSTELLNAGLAGARVVAPAILILWFASTISTMTSNKSHAGEVSSTFAHQDHRLYTGDYLKSVLIVTSADQSIATDSSATTVTATQTPRFPLFLLPTVVFVLAGVVAFCTGTSWGTMGILMPMVIPLAYTLLSAVTPDPNAILHHPLMLCSAAGVLSGAIFGDHCSPISDTTVLSSQSCSCDHLAHVWTQMPYAAMGAAFSILLGTLPIGLGVPLWILWPIQLVAVVALLMFFGKKTDVDQ